MLPEKATKSHEPKRRCCMYLRESSRPKLRALMHLLSAEKEITGMSDMVDTAVDFMYRAYSGRDREHGQT